MRERNFKRVASQCVFKFISKKHEQRRYVLRNLRDFGLGCRHTELETELNDELLNLIDLIKNGPKYDFEKVAAYLC